MTGPKSPPSEWQYVAAAYLVGAGAGPGWRGYRFVLVLTAVWAAGMMGLNAVLGSNYGYLNGKPVTHSLLDLLGPWPWYIGSLVLLCGVFYTILYLPFFIARRAKVLD